MELLNIFINRSILFIFNKLNFNILQSFFIVFVHYRYLKSKKNINIYINSYRGSFKIRFILFDFLSNINIIIKKRFILRINVAIANILCFSFSFCIRYLHTRYLLYQILFWPMQNRHILINRMNIFSLKLCILYINKLKITYYDIFKISDFYLTTPEACTLRLIKQCTENLF